MLKTKIFYLLLLILSANLSTYAQTKKQKNKRKAPEAQTDTQTPEEMLYEKMLPSTAQIMIIDSVVADKKDFITKIPLNKESGTIETYDKFWKTTGQPSSYTYMNEFGNKAFFSKTDTAGHCKLYTADKLNGQWTNIKLISDFGNEFEDINHPFMMSDGITLYFSAKNKNNLGGYDIYVTRYDADSARFYKPENIGLPYNSTGNDYYCITDEFDELGWLVTDRHQPEGKVCIYTFVPSSSRTIYDKGTTDEDKLRSLADIRSIKDTWTNGGKLQAAKNRLTKLLQRRNTGESSSISFIINDNTVYTKPEDFKSPTNKKRFAQLCKMRQEADRTSEKLDEYRKRYSAGEKNKLAGEIRSMEESLERQHTYIHTLEKEIRNTENLIINKK